MSEHEYLPSPSPEEDWGDTDREWVVDGVVGESIDAFGQKRYEVKWGEGWNRNDGTNTTWEHPREDLEELIHKWERKQTAKRMEKAKASPAIAINVEDWHMLHENRTIERARGYEELKKLYIRGDPRQPIDFDGQLKRLKPVRNNSHTASKTLTSRSVSVAQSSREASREKSKTPGSVASSSGPSQRPIKPLPKRSFRRLPSSSPAPDSEEEKETGRRAPPRETKRRRALEKKWAESLNGAAPVTFVNDISYEEVPPLVPDFQYLERRYVRADGVSSAEHRREFLLSCECERRCLDADDCECQKPSGLQTDDGHGIFAYNKKKLFNFKLPLGMGLEVIECNENCTCDERCHNRVAQLPRDVPIEIFLTQTHGWGARATVPVPRGKVIGVYTGTREVAEQRHALGDGRKSYIFDLDVHEGDDDDDEDESAGRYSVDGYAHGNWTRFVNHSCEPNMRVVPVVWDTIPELKQPFLAFVATEDIPPRTELTIDYDPNAALEAQKSNGKRPRTRPEGARECMCNTDSCRGWIRV
ncbi:SET domain-containing protein [Dichomitus squalens]|uniref:SET domain-containing protein n=1 Tax=Dichomitus squalens TaxID=114155 RepID=A0A4Q9MG69_9APHY|nr:SET domain-containing protein [Dichomitus squalens]